MPAKLLLSLSENKMKKKTTHTHIPKHKLTVCFSNLLLIKSNIFFIVIKDHDGPMTPFSCVDENKTLYLRKNWHM